MKAYGDILNEIGDAVDYVRSQGGIILAETVEQQTAAGEILAELPDDEVLKDYFSAELPELAPNQVSVKTLSEFELAYVALGNLHGAMKREFIDKDLTHEDPHMEANEAAGLRNSAFVLTVNMSRRVETQFGQGIEFGWRPAIYSAGPTRPITKLLVASLVAAPDKLSRSDTARIEAMGYTGPEDVAQRIRGATTAEMRSLLIPRAAR